MVWSLLRCQKYKSVTPNNTNTAPATQLPIDLDDFEEEKTGDAPDKAGFLEDQGLDDGGNVAPDAEGWKPHYFALGGPVLTFAAKAGDTPPLGAVRVGECDVNDPSPDDPCVFSLTLPDGKKATFKAKSPEEATDWVAKLKAAKDKAPKAGFLEDQGLDDGGNVEPNAEGWKPHYFALEGPFLTFAEKPGDTPPLGAVSLAHCDVNDPSPDDPCVFSLTLPDGKKATFKAKSPEEAADWVAKLKAAKDKAPTGQDRAFAPSQAKGGGEIDPSTTAIVCIEFQNEFATEGGKLYPAVAAVMKSNSMLANTAAVCEAARAKGAKVIHAPISFAADASDNPNRNLGILAGCNNDSLFTAGTWNSEICDSMTPQDGDLVVKGKKGLDAFPGTDLEALLRANNIETIALAGFLTNCCVESTMRTAFEKGFNVVTLTDCTACTSLEGQAAAAGPNGTFGMFSTPMAADELKTKLDNVPPEDKALPVYLPVSSAPDRAFAPDDAKGGGIVDPKKTAIVCIEFQNEFATEGGKLYPAVAPVMQSNNMLANTVGVCQLARECGAVVFHSPISFGADASDNPNRNLGILAGCNNDSLFTAGTWNAEICDAMKPAVGDVVITGKKGLDAFPGTNLEAKLKEHGIETIVLTGFLTNCCVESTMRKAYEKGFNVITLTDCTAATSAAGQEGAAGPNGTFGMFSTPMAADDFKPQLEAAKNVAKVEAGPAGEDCPTNAPCFSGPGGSSSASAGPDGKCKVRFLKSSVPSDKTKTDAVAKAVAKWGPGYDLATRVVDCSPAATKLDSPVKVIIPVQYGADPVSKVIFKRHNTSLWWPISFGQTADKKTVTVELNETGYIATLKAAPKGSLFDAVEDTDRAECLDALVDLDKRNKEAPEEAPDKAGFLADKGLDDGGKVEPDDDGWKRHFFVLEGRHLRFTGTPDDIDALGTIDVADCELEDPDPDAPSTFSLTLPDGKKVQFKAKSPSEAADWVEKFKAAKAGEGQGFYVGDMDAKLNPEFKEGKLDKLKPGSNPEDVASYSPFFFVTESPYLKFTGKKDDGTPLGTIDLRDVEILRDPNDPKLFMLVRANGDKIILKAEDAEEVSHGRVRTGHEI